ncbi:MAG TPA: alpha/beta hydrolase [Acidimicrobiia bacterium]|nr:alpha/beta hydrolase [Acidimicrobiia bacterium]
MPTDPTARSHGRAAIDGGLTLSYVKQGDPSGPALVFLPGPTDSWPSYEPVLARLPSSIRAIAVSQRGHGDSDKPAHGYRVEDFAADVVPFLDALGIERAVLAGHSGSCLVARRVAIDAPERVAGLVLEASPSTLRGEVALEAFVESVVSGLKDPIDPSVARSTVVDTSHEQMDPGVLDRLVAEVLKVPAHVWKEMFADLSAHDDTADLRSIAAPVLLVWGDSDQIVGPDMQNLLVRHIPDATLLVYTGVGHTPRWQDPRRFAADVAAFVSDVCAHGR